MMLGVSSGTATVLGLQNKKSLADPTTAYIMLGNQCRNSCSFCNRWKTAKQKLSRITWPLFEENEVINSIVKAYDEGKIYRVCFQVTCDRDKSTEHTLLSSIRKIKNGCSVPLSISAGIEHSSLLDALFEAGADNLALPIDAATPELFAKIKKKDWNETLDFLYSIADKYKWRISTHLIVGLGETQEEAVKMLLELHEHKITVGLFAFTPLPGTDMAKKSPPPMNVYRKIQLAHWLIKNEKYSFIFFENENIFFDPKTYDFVCESKNMGDIFRTSGCSLCNRPFYNEKPGQLPYNYPVEMTEIEQREALKLALD